LVPAFFDRVIEVEQAVIEVNEVEPNRIPLRSMSAKHIARRAETRLARQSDA
jgi:hypothetical protein